MSEEQDKEAKRHGKNVPGFSAISANRSSNAGNKMDFKHLLMYAYAHYKPLRDLYQINGVCIDEMTRFTSLPFLSKKWLSAYPLEDSFAVPQDRLSRIFTTTGTTGKPQYVGFTQNDWRRYVDLLSDNFKMLGLGSRHVFYNMLPGTSGIGSWLAMEAASQTGAVTIQGGLQEIDNHLRLINDVKPNAFTGLAFFILRIGEVMPAALRQKVSLIAVVGEPLHAPLRKRLEALFPAAHINCGYGITEVMGVCACCKCGKYHFKESDFIVETISPDENGIGELVFTSLKSEAMPLVRYRSGDRGKILSDSCPGVSSSPAFEVYSRCDDMTNIKGKLVSISQLKAIVLAEKGVSGATCVYENNTGTLILYYSGICDEDSLRDKIRSTVGVTPELQNNENIKTAQWKTLFFKSVE